MNLKNGTFVGDSIKLSHWGRVVLAARCASRLCGLSHFVSAISRANALPRYDDPDLPVGEYWSVVHSAIGFVVNAASQARVRVNSAGECERIRVLAYSLRPELGSLGLTGLALTAGLAPAAACDTPAPDIAARHAVSQADAAADEIGSAIDNWDAIQPVILSRALDDWSVLSNRLYWDERNADLRAVARLCAGATSEIPVPQSTFKSILYGI